MNPTTNGSLTVTGGELRLTVPAGSLHDVWSTGDNSARVMQTIGNADFEVVVKFDTQVTSNSQMEGIIVEQDVNTFLRFDFRNDGVSPRIFAASISGGAGTFRVDVPLSANLAAPLWLKVKRTGNSWTESWSSDGTNYTLGGTFNFTLTVSKIGPFVGNYGNPASAAPAMTAAVDYFYNTANFPVSPDMTITKSHVGNFTQGGAGTYTITARNSGSAPTSGTITVTDTLPTGLSATSFSGTGWACTITLPVNCTRSDALAAGVSYPAMTLAVGVAASAPSSVTNSVSVAGGGETNTFNDTASDPTIVGSNAGAPVSDDFTGTTLNTALWTFVNPLNNGSYVVSGGDLRLTVPAGTVHDVWTTGDNASRAMQTIGNVDFEVAVKFDSSVTAFSQMEGIIVEQDSSNFLRFDFRNDGASPRLFAASIAGGTGTFRVDIPLSTGITPPLWLKVKRTGNSWTESWSQDGTNYTLGGTFTFALTASKIGPFSGNYGNPASSAPAFTAPVDYFSNTASPIAPDLTITKSHTGNFTQGGTGSYTITASNAGTGSTSGTVTVTDTVPAGLTATGIVASGWNCAALPAVSCTRSDALAAGASYPALALTVSVSPSAPSSVTNTVTVSGGGETNTANDTASDQTTVAGSGQAPDLTITKSHTGNFTPGTTGTYTITAANSGNAATSGTVTVTDTVPAGLTATAFSGNGWVCALSPTVNCTRSDALAAASGYPAMTLTVSVASNAPLSVTNIATVAGGGETNTSNDTASDVTTITGVPDLTITKSHVGNFTPGGSGAYTITAKNSGNASTSGTVTVTDTVPAGLTATAFSGNGWVCALTPTVNCTRNDVLAAAASYPALTLNVSVQSNAPLSVTNTATVAGGGETNTSNDTASDVTTITGVPDLTITKSHVGNFTPGGSGAYTITAKNSGNASTSGTVTVTDTVPAGLTATAFSGNGWVCALTPTVNCTRNDVLAAAASYPALTLNVSVQSNAPLSVTNTATVAGGGETNTANDTASDVTTITGVPDLTITKSHVGNFTQGGTGTYTITATNGGNAATSGTATVTDTVPVGLMATAFSGTGWVCALTPTVNCTRSDALAGGASYPALTLTVSVASNAPVSVTNTVTVAGGGETNTANDSASDPTSVAGSAPPISDDFHSSTLNAALWTFENPLGDATLRTTGTNILLSLPAGTSHDAWTPSNNAARIVQTVPNGNFSVEVLFQSSVTAQYQTEGILAEQDAANFTRFDIYSDGSQTHLFAASIAGGSSATIWLDSIIPSGTWPLYLRVTRTGNTWTSSWSTNGVSYNAGANFTYATTVNKLGPFASNAGPTPPAFTASIDYFFNTLSPISPEDAGLPGLVTISATPSMTGAVVTWVTDKPATSKVDYGLTPSYGSSTTVDNTLLTGHSVGLSSLTCNTAYNYRVVSTDGSGNTSSSSNQTFTTGLCGASGPVSDDFSGGSLNTSLWAVVNPVNDGGSVTVNSSGAQLNVPGGNSHDVWVTGNNSVRIMQNIANADFDVEVKFTSVVGTAYQMQGIIVEQDSTNFLRFDILFGNCEASVFSATFSNGSPTVWLNSAVRNGNNVYMRLKRTGSNWAFSYSYDSRRWTPAFQFVRSMNVTKIGPFAGNAGVNGGASPAFTSTVNYFINRGAPPATVHGQPYPGGSVSPAITLFYGNSQTFGQNGLPQQWVNLLGNITGFYGISSLSYSLNGGAAQNLWMGENAVRLVEPGDFNVEIDYASLSAGANNVVISATDNIGNVVSQSVTLTYVSGQTWPKNTTIDWSLASSIQSVSQIVDGQWQIQGGTVRPLQIGGSTPIAGYDRLISFGDRGTWQNYDVTAQVTINSFSCHDFGVGFVVGWQGHTTLQYGQPLPDQPRTGHPFPGLFWYSMEPNTASGLNIYTNTPARPETRLVQDTSTQLQVGIPYTYRFRVEPNGIQGGSHYSYKVWQTGQAEPAAWTLQVDGELSQGSIVIGLHKADASIGKIVVTGL